MSNAKPYGRFSLCAVCGRDLDSTVNGFSTLHRVTSDCKPYPAGGRLCQCLSCGTVQKPNDAEWQADCNAIYSNYENYGLSGGQEQSVRGGRNGEQYAPRSELVLNAFRNSYRLPRSGRMLDYGCGVGPTTRAAAELLRGWTIDGYDLDRRAEPALQAIPVFGRLYSGAPDNIDQAYDLIVLMHALEHIPDARSVLGDLARLLNPDGRILIQVPNRLANPFDLLVADHAIHFDPRSLHAIALNSGTTVSYLSHDWVVKELSLVIGEGPELYPEDQPAIAASSQVDWLTRIAEICRVAASRPNLGIFGTSIVATWLRSELGRAPDFYLDEDPGKNGRCLEGVPILHPDEAAPEASVLMAMAPKVARAVAGRFAHLNLDIIQFPAYDF